MPHTEDDGGEDRAAYAGPPPKSEGTEYCWGGCPGAIEEAIEILRELDRLEGQ